MNEVSGCVATYIDNRGVVQDYYYMHSHAKVLSSKHLEMIVLEVQLHKIADSEKGGESCYLQNCDFPCTQSVDHAH